MSGPTTRSRTRKRGSEHHPDEQTDLDSGLNLPHMPVHFHINQNDEQDGKQSTMKEGLGRDKYNIAVLMFLYILQGIPLGLAGSVPYLLQSRQVNYKDQALFSFVFWPFSVKLLWAPIVDAIYIKSFGRRKSWLVPVQYLIGTFMILLSTRIKNLMGEGESSGTVNILTLTIVFFCLNFLAATQDIAVDGWALTMLSRQNVGWASTCNSVGQTAGYFLGNVVFMALESPEFCNAYLRSVPQPEGIVTLATFLRFWGFVFFVSTTLVAMLKREKEDEEETEGVVDTYKLLMKIIRLPAVISLIIVLLTSKIGFAAADAVTGLKLIEEGVPKEKLALLGVPMVPIQIILPLIISKYTSGPRPMDMWLKAIPYRLFMGLVFALLVWWAPSTKSSDGVYPLHFYAVILFVYAIHQVTLYTMFVSQMAFHAQISDPTIGGTYMTLLNTVANLGGNWPSSVVLWLIDDVTWKTCEGAKGQEHFCDTAPQVEACTKAGGSCVTQIDGYYIECVVCVVIGILWLLWRRRRVQQLQSLEKSAWKDSS